jgi:uncharacterized protein YukE
MSWVGGDITGLIAMGDTLTRVSGNFKGIGQALDRDVDKLASDATWTGDAATNFRKAWTIASFCLAGIEGSYEEFGKAISQLGQQLSDLENQLYQVATDDKADGAQIGEDGKPLPLSITGDPDAPAAVKAIRAQRDYNEFYTEIRKLAQGHRLQAASNINAISHDIAPDTKKKEGPAWDKAVTIAAMVKGLYSVPAMANDHLADGLPKTIDGLKDELGEADKALEKSKASYLAFAGQPRPPGAWDFAEWNHQNIAGNLAKTEAQLDSALKGGGELPFTKTLTTSVGDLARMANAADWAEMPKGLKFLNDIPVIDVLAAGVVGNAQTVDDVQKGWSPKRAEVMDYGSQAAGVAAGVGGTALAAFLLPEEAAAGAVIGAGALVTVTAWGVGDIASALTHEHWDEQIQSRGYLSGITHGLSDSVSKGWAAMQDDVSGAADAVSGLWDKVFG